MARIPVDELRNGGEFGRGPLECYPDRQSGALLGVWEAGVDDMLLYGVLGVILGGRLGYVLFYKPGYYAANPLEVSAGVRALMPQIQAELPPALKPRIFMVKTSLPASSSNTAMNSAPTPVAPTLW